MITKIICPTDLSDVANNATEYAARLAQVLQAELVLLNIQRVVPILEPVNLDEGATAYVRNRSHEVIQKLKTVSKEVADSFGISVSYEVDITSQSLTNFLSGYSTSDYLMVMGTHGADNLYRFFFGTNTSHVIKKVRCPVLMVPKNASYNGINNIVMARDDEDKSDFSVSMIKDFIRAFSPKLTILQVNSPELVSSKEDLTGNHAELFALPGERLTIDAEQIFSDDVPASINNFMLKSNADLLALLLHKKTISDLFQGSTAENIIESCDYPVLILHS